MKKGFAVLFLLALCMTLALSSAWADELVLPAGLKEIGEEAFYGSISIDKVVLSNNVTEIKAKAFANSTLSEINLPDSLSTIADDAFEGTNLKKVTASEGSYAWKWAVLNRYLAAAFPWNSFPVYLPGTSEYPTNNVTVEHNINKGAFQLDCDVISARMATQQIQDQNIQVFMLAYGLNEVPDYDDPSQINRRVGDFIINKQVKGTAYAQLILQASISNSGMFYISESELSMAPFFKIHVGFSDVDGDYPTSWFCMGIKVTDEEIVEPESISLNLANLTLNVDESAKLIATLSPDNVTETNIYWESSDTSIAIVDDGIVKGVTTGETVITAKTVNGFTAECNVHVVDDSMAQKIISGYLHSKRQGVSIADAKIEVRASEDGTVITQTTTDESGHYSFTLTQGDYVLTATKEGFAKLEQLITVSPQIGEYSFIMTEYINEEGYIYDAQHHEPLGQVTIIAIDINNNANTVTTISDDNGYYAITLLPGNYRFTAEAEGYPSFEKIVTINYGNETFDIFIGKGHVELRGNVYDRQTNEYIDGASIELRNESDSATITSTTTNQDGSFEISAVPGKYVIKVTKREYMDYVYPLTMSYELEYQDFILARELVCVKGNIRDRQTDDYVEDVSIIMQDKTGDYPSVTTTTDAYGDFEIYVKAGDYTITATKQNYITYQNDIKVSYDIEYQYIKLSRGLVRIRGNVRDRQTDDYVGNATITLRDISDSQTIASAVTDSYGDFELEVEPGNYILKAIKQEYVTYQKNMAISYDVEYQDIQLSGEFVCVKGTIIDRDTYDSARNVTVELRNENDDLIIASDTTDSNGYYEFDVTPGTYVIKGTKENYAGFRKTINVTYEIEDCDFFISQLESDGDIVSGLVTALSDGSALANVSINVRNQSNTETVSETVTDDNGYYSLNLVPGTYIFSLSKNGYADTVQNITVSSNVKDYYFTMAAYVNIYGYTRDRQSQEAISDVDISIKREGETTAAVEFTSNDDGYYSVDILPGTYTVTATEAHYGTCEQTIIFSDGYYDIFLYDEYIHVDGRIIDRQSNNIIEDADITFVDDENNIYELSADKCGEFAVDLRPGGYLLTVLKAGYDDYSEELYIDYDTESLEITVACQNVHIEGNVYDKQTRNGVGGAMVKITDMMDQNVKACVTTDNDGFFTFDVPNGSYIINVMQTGYNDYRTNIVIDYDTGYQEIVIARNLVRVEGCIIDRQTHEGIDDVIVTLSSEEENAVAAQSTTDEEGYFSFDVLPGQYNIKATKTGYNEFLENKEINYSIEYQSITMMRPVVHVEGVIRDRQSSEAVENVEIEVLNEGGIDTVLTVTTDEEGYYELELTPGMYTFKASKADYSGFEQVLDISYDIGSIDFTISPLRIKLHGHITGSLTKTGLSGVTIRILDSNAIVMKKETTTDAEGYYSIMIDPGNYVIKVSKEGFIEDEKSICVDWEAGELDFLLLTELTDNQYRVRITWGETPRDLDSHVVGYTSSGEQYHVYFSAMDAYEGELNICNLDVDDTTSYGPEVITLTPVSERPYYYYVHNFSGEGSIPTSSVRIEVFKGNTLIRTFGTPSGGSDLYWNVFAIVNDVIIVKNTLSSDPDVDYANSPQIEVSGTVHTPAGEAVSDVYVFAANTEDEADTKYAITNADGEWHMDLHEGKTYTFEYASMSYSIAGSTVTVTDGMTLNAVAELQGETNDNVTFTMRQNGEEVSSVLVGTAVDFSVSAPGAKYVRLVVDGKVYEEYTVTDGVVQFSRTISLAGNRSIQFQTMNQGEYAFSEISNAKPLQVNAPNGTLAEVTIHEIGTFALDSSENFVISWDGVPNAVSYTVYLYANGKQYYPLVNGIDEATTENTMLEIPLSKVPLFVGEDWSASVVTVGAPGYSSSTSSLAFKVVNTLGEATIVDLPANMTVRLGDIISGKVESKASAGTVSLCVLAPVETEETEIELNDGNFEFVADKAGTFVLKLYTEGSNECCASAVINVPDPIIKLDSKGNPLFDVNGYKQFEYEREGTELTFHITYNFLPTRVRLYKNDMIIWESENEDKLASFEITDNLTGINTVSNYKVVANYGTNINVTTQVFPVYCVAEQTEQQKNWYAVRDTQLFQRPDGGIELSTIPAKALVTLGKEMFKPPLSNDYNYEVTYRGQTGFVYSTDIMAYTSLSDDQLIISSALDGVTNKVVWLDNEEDSKQITFTIQASANVDKLSVFECVVPASDYLNPSLWGSSKTIERESSNAFFTYTVTFDQLACYDIEFAGLDKNGDMLTDYIQAYGQYIPTVLNKASTHVNPNYAKCEAFMEHDLTLSPVDITAVCTVDTADELTVMGTTGGRYSYVSCSKGNGFILTEDLLSKPNHSVMRAYVLLSADQFGDIKYLDNEKYENNAYSRGTYAAKLMLEFFMRKGIQNSNIVYDLATTSDEMDYYLEEMVNANDFNDIIYLYIGGHGNKQGIALDNNDLDPFPIAWWRNPESVSSIYKYSRFVDKLSGLKGNFVFFNSPCHSGAVIKYFDNFDRKKVSIITSAKSSQSAYSNNLNWMWETDDDQSCNYFAISIYMSLREKNTRITLSEAYYSAINKYNQYRNYFEKKYNNYMQNNAPPAWMGETWLTFEEYERNHSPRQEFQIFGDPDNVIFP